MAPIPAPPRARNDYPTWAPTVSESDIHRIRMFELIDTLQGFFEGQQVYVTGNLLVFYEQGNRRRHVSPDVWLARGVEPMLRDNFLIWEEPSGPEFVIELTSATTRNEDQTTKFELFRDVLRVNEYFLFDPRGEYLDPPLLGYRLRGGGYHPIQPVEGRLPSEVTGLHLEADGNELRLWEPTTRRWVPTRQDLLEDAQRRLEAKDRDAENEQKRYREQQQRFDALKLHAEQQEDSLVRLAERAKDADERAKSADERAKDAEAEIERLRRELDRLRGGQ